MCFYYTNAFALSMIIEMPLLITIMVRYAALMLLIISDSVRDAPACHRSNKPDDIGAIITSK